MKTENRRNTPITGLTAALLATAIVTALTAQGAFAMVDEQDVNTTEASESGVVIVSGAGPRGDVKYVRPDSDARIVGYVVSGPVGRLSNDPAR